MRQRVSKLTAILLVLCMALALLPGTALAEETTGTCGENVTWSLSGGVLTLSGTGPMKDYLLFDVSPWFNFSDEVESLKIGEGITSVGSFAFYCCANLGSVTIPGSVTSIGDHSFDGCTSLTGVTIPGSVTSIGSSAFEYCTSLTSVTIPDGVTEIKEGTFDNCSGLTSVTIPVSVTSIDMVAFQECTSLKDVYYGGSESQWEQITIGEDNEALTGANIHYNSAAPSAGTTPEPSPEPTPAPSPDPDPAPSSSAGISVTVGGNAVVWTDAEPFIDANDRTMVPLRAVADAMSLTVNWDAAAREASFTDGSKTIIFPIDSTTARTSDGGTVQMDTAAVIVNDRTYAPIRYLAEFFGCTVGWDAGTRTVSITE